MKILIQPSILFLALLFNLSLCKAQNNSLTREYKKEVIQNISQLINDFYVFPEVAKLTEAHLKSQLLNGYYDHIENDEAFAIALTQSVQSINKDKHMRIWPNRPGLAPNKTKESMFEDHLTRINRSREGNAGFKTVKILDGNVGYLDLRGFAGMETGKDIADAYMKLMSRTDAIIIDLRKNGGGSPNMVQYLCSYFFNQKLLLNSLYWRQGNRTQDFWTLEKVGGIKLNDVPLFILTSHRTFSGAEEFSYNMQTQKRATLVGQITGGGANPGRSMRINDNLRIFVPMGRAINPITKTNWEGVGVVPEIETIPKETYDKAVDLAKEAAMSFRAKRKEIYSQLFSDLNYNLDHYTKSKSDDLIVESLRKCLDAKLFDEDDINNLGYEYLNKFNKPKRAESILRANMILHPNSANAYDSYAESLMINGNLEASLKNYQRAVEIATKNQEQNLNLFQENLERLKQKLDHK